MTFISQEQLDRICVIRIRSFLFLINNNNRRRRRHHHDRHKDNVANLP